MYNSISSQGDFRKKIMFFNISPARLHAFRDSRFKRVNSKNRYFSNSKVFFKA